jgi:hypothetical protein
MAKAKGIGDLLTGILLSTGKSLVTSELKKQAKGIIGARFAKTPEKARQEAAQMLGYETDHFTMDKKENIVFKSSSDFMHEWLTKSPYTVNKLMKDEENGQVFFNGLPLSPSIKMDLITKFRKATNINSPAVAGHLENALEFLDLSDFTSLKFKKEFAGWDPSQESVIDTFLPRAFGTALAPEDVPDASRLFRKWIIGTAKRALEPGSSHDGCFTIKGPAGVGKTRFFRELLPEPFNNRTGEILCDIKSPQKFVESIVGKTVACFDELSVLEVPKTQETFKQLLTSQFIDVRMVWARKPQRYALRQGFAATTNRDRFIPEKSFKRRMWVVKLNSSQRLDFDFLHDNRKALWQEAVYLVGKGETGILSYDEQKALEEANTIYEE